MARLVRLSVPGHLHLMIQRAQQGQAVFADPADRRAYLHCLAEAAAKHGVAIHAYGMAPAELRLLATPPDAQALGRMVQFVGRRYVAGFNRRHGRTGALWEGRFRATVIEPSEYFLPCLRYVETGFDGTPREPATEGAPWSSADHHAGHRTDPFVTEHAQFWSLGNTPFEREAAYRSAVAQPMAPAEAQGIALASLHGWVLGSGAFERALAARLGRRLKPLSPGRPPTRRAAMPLNISDPK
jgi:putative transposase